MATGAWARRRRERIRKQEFPPEWLAVLRSTLPRFARLTPEDQAELEGHIQVFLAEKRFEGAAGLAITDEIRVTIAAQACLLLLHRDTDDYPGLASIIVYPHEYIATQRVRDELGLVREAVQVRLGETGARGAVVVSWDAALRGASDANEGRSVVFHEFAHLLDAEAGGFDGAPLLPLRSMYDRWTRVMREEYAALQARATAAEATDLDPYGATSPAEFFAVATERFFQEPHSLQRDHPALFAELAGYYRQDPRSSMDDVPG
jgi:Mlc titration factor MtfA (ptsG expression regulator)